MQVVKFDGAYDSCGGGPMINPSTNDLRSKATTSKIALLQETELTTIPEKSWSEWGIALLLFVATCLYLHIFCSFIFFGGQDEGIIFQGADRILKGQVLYRDFFTFYTPGSY